MRRRLIGSLLVSSALLIGGLATNASAAPVQQRSTYIIVFKNGVDPRGEADVLRGQGYEIRQTYEYVFPGVAVDLPAAAARSLANNPNVQLVEPDAVVTALDTQSNATWGLDRSDERVRALNKSYTYPASAGYGVRTYIIDTGILTSHQDFEGRWEPGATAIDDGRGATDCNGHGTHVAATVAGKTWGIAKRATVVPVRVLDCTGSGTTSGVIAGVDWVTANAKKPAVANLSLGGGASSALDTAVINLHKSGVPVSVAAGNSNTLACNSSPARAADVITVGATTSADARASYSNYGTCLDIFAPGSSITSAWYTSTTATNTISGTSMASPHVAGAAALLLGENDKLTSAEVRNQLVNTATSNVLSSIGTGSPNKLLYVSMPAPPVSITTTSLPEGTFYAVYPSTQLSATGGDGVNYTWTASGLPAGLTLSGNTISGTPTVTGTFSVAVTATSAGKIGSATLSLTVVEPVVPYAAVTITTESLPAGTQNSAYPSTMLTATGGDGVNYTWTQSGLPAGLALSGNTISGTPTVAGTFTVTLTASSVGQTDSTVLSITIAAAAVTTIPGTFSKSSPASGAGSQSPTPTLVWTAAMNAASYQVCMSTKSFTTTCPTTWTNVGNVTTVIWPTLLNGGATYYWQVRAVNAIGIRVASNSTWRFTTVR